MRQFIGQVPPFSVLPPKELDDLMMFAALKNYEKGEVIYGEGDPADSVWVLKTGRIQIFKFMSSGRPHVVESLGPKELFGTLCRIGENGMTYPCSAVASTRCSVIRVQNRKFMTIYNRFPAVVRGVCSLCSQRLNEMQGSNCNAQEPVERRIAGVLMQLQKEHGNTLPFTKREISELAATTVETTIRTISTFAKKGWISSSRGKIALQEPSKIKTFLNVLSD